MSNDELRQALFELRYALRRHRRLAMVVAVVIIGGALLQATLYTVGPEQEGVVLRFGEHLKSTPSGLHAKLPWPIERVITVPIERYNTLEFGFATQRPGKRTVYYDASAEQKEVARLLTGDLNLAHVEWIVQYRIKDAYQFLFGMGGPGDQAENVEDTIRDVSESVMRRLVGDVSVDEVLTKGRDRIANDARNLIQEQLDGFECGVEVAQVKLQTVSPPDEVKDAFDSVNRAQQKKERVINEARGERNRLIPEARGKRDRAIAESEGYRERVVKEAQGEANAFLARLEEYRKAPEVTRRRLYIEAMEEVLAQVDEIVVIDEAVRGLLPMLDLNAGGSVAGGTPARTRPAKGGAQ